MDLPSTSVRSLQPGRMLLSGIPDHQRQVGLSVGGLTIPKPRRSVSKTLKTPAIANPPKLATHIVDTDTQLYDRYWQIEVRTNGVIDIIILLQRR